MTNESGITLFNKSMAIEATLTATPQTILALALTLMTAKGLNRDEVSGWFFMEKVAAGTDRGPILVGDDASRMNIYHGAGIASDVMRSLDMLAARSGVSDVPAILVLGLK